MKTAGWHVSAIVQRSWTAYRAERHPLPIWPPIGGKEPPFLYRGKKINPEEYQNRVIFFERMTEYYIKLVTHKNKIVILRKRTPSTEKGRSGVVLRGKDRSRRYASNIRVRFVTLRRIDENRRMARFRHRSKIMDRLSGGKTPPSYMTAYRWERTPFPISGKKN